MLFYDTYILVFMEGQTKINDKINYTSISGWCMYVFMSMSAFEPENTL